MRGMKLQSLLACLLGLLWASGCVVHASDDRCDTQCNTYCDVYCDPFGCWEECWDECWDVCYDYDDDNGGSTPVREPGCRVDAECSQGDRCDAGACVPERGSAGLCQACTSNFDCVEEDARCLRLEGNTGGVCGRACDTQDDCPASFDCIAVSQELGAPHQCIPASNPDTGARSCEVSDDPTPTPDCVRSEDCDPNQTCVDGACVDPQVECRRSADCDEGQLCVDARCRQACDADRPCAEGLVCEAPGYCKEGL